MLDYSEKRDFPRMAVDCPAKLKGTNGEVFGTAIVKDLSGGGMLLWTGEVVQPGSFVQVTITPTNTITPPLSAELEVIRCSPVELESEFEYSVACTITRLLNSEPD